MGFKAMRCRLFPNVTQEKALDTTLYLCRQLYNAALEERRGAYKKSGVSVGFYEQKRSLTEVKDVAPEYKGTVVRKVSGGGSGSE